MFPLFLIYSTNCAITPSLSSVAKSPSESKYWATFIAKLDDLPKYVFSLFFKSFLMIRMASKYALRAILSFEKKDEI